jgi:Sulfotransferase domain
VRPEANTCFRACSLHGSAVADRATVDISVRWPSATSQERAIGGAHGLVSVLAMHEVWPNFFLVGAAKAGTTSAFAYLSQHPQVFFPRIKEPHFFTQIHPSRKQRYFVESVTDYADYLRLFRGAGGFRVVGDASPSYLWHPDVPRRFRARVPEARIAIILRDPLQRAHSHYLMDYREGVQNLNFYDALVEDMNRREKGWGISSLYFELGQYAQQVKRYLETFQPRQIKVLFYEDFRRDVKGALCELAKFLELNTAAIERIDTSKAHNSYAEPRSQLMRRLAGAKLSRILGRTLMPREAGQFIFEKFFLRHACKPPLDPRARDLLRTLYDPDVSELEKTLGSPLSQLRCSWGDA